MEVKTRFVVANGDGVGFDYWAAAAGGDTDSEERIRVLYFDVWSWAGVDGLQGIEELWVKCQGVAVGFQKGAWVGFMVDAVKTCTVKVGWSTGADNGSVELAAVGVSISIFTQASKVAIYPLLSVTASFVAEEVAICSEIALKQENKDLEESSNESSSASI